MEKSSRTGFCVSTKRQLGRVSAHRFAAVGVFQGAEVFAVDPQQIDGTAFTASGAGFGLDALYRVGGIRNMHDAQVDSVVAFTSPLTQSR
jgi:hypothetical protein